MWTICWIDEHYANKWDRLEHKNDVVEKLEELKASGIIDMNDVLVFPPDAEVSAEDVLRNFV